MWFIWISTLNLWLKFCRTKITSLKFMTQLLFSFGCWAGNHELKLVVKTKSDVMHRFSDGFCWNISHLSNIHWWNPIINPQSWNTAAEKPPGCSCRTVNSHQIFTKFYCGLVRPDASETHGLCTWNALIQKYSFWLTCVLLWSHRDRHWNHFALLVWRKTASTVSLTVYVNLCHSCDKPKFIHHIIYSLVIYSNMYKVSCLQLQWIQKQVLYRNVRGSVVWIPQRFVCR